jgi:DNA-binding MarR family transcriptional regulator
MFDEALSPVGLRNTQYAILVELAARETAPSSIQELAAAMVLERSVLGRALKPLEREGLVAVLEDPVDHRRRHVVLTAKGKATERRAGLLWDAAERRLSDLFGEEKKSSLAVELIRIAYDLRFGAMSG